MSTATAKKPRETLTLRDTTDLLGALNRYVEDHIDEIELNGGALPDDLAAMLDEITMAQRDRADAIAVKLDEFLGYATAAKATKDRATRRQKVWDNTIAAMKAYVLRELDRMGTDRISGVVAVLRRQVNSAPAVDCVLSPRELLDIAMFDGEQDDVAERPVHPLVRFLTVKYEAVLDRKALATAYLARREVLVQEAAARISEAAISDIDHLRIADFTAHVPRATEAEGVEAVLHDMRLKYVSAALAAEFPGVSVSRGSHLRID